MKYKIATGIAAVVAAGSMLAASALPAEASSNARPHKAAAHQTHKPKNPHAGMRCAKYNMTGTHRTSCAAYVKR